MRTTRKPLNSRPTPLEHDADPRLKPERGPARLEYLPVSALKPHPRNPRIHPGKQIYQIAASIEEFGFVNPILVDAESRIIAGHGRVEAAKLLGLQRVPTVCIDHLSPTQRRAYVIADNKLAEKAGWDRDILKLEFEELSITEPSLELELTGFETSEIDVLLDGPRQFLRDDPLDRIPPPPSVAVSKLGDLWHLGDHRIFCGDAREASSYSLLMGDERARLLFTDPPYNVPIEGHVSGLGKLTHREFPMACGEMTKEEFTTFLVTVLHNAANVTQDGAIHFVCMDWRHIEEILLAGRKVYSELKNVCVWTKDNGGMGSFYRSQHELVFVFKAGSAPHINTVQLGAHGRYRTNVWNYPGASSMRPGRNAELSMHPTVKPVALVIDAIKDCSRRGDLVLDPFGGSGTTLIAAEKSKRQARLMELDPGYVDVTIVRWQKLTGLQALHAPTGKTFAAARVVLQKREMGRGSGQEDAR